jgi:toxin-antitoxin system PIN domain toxin
VIVLDVNLLIYASDGNAVLHEAARRWLQSIISGSELIGLPWQTIDAFVRISTNPRVSGGQVSIEQAIGAIEHWMDLPQVRVLSPGERHWGILKDMLTEGQARGPLATNAGLAAVTIEYGGVLHTTDRGFARFPGLRWVNPLAAA